MRHRATKIFVFVLFMLLMAASSLHALPSVRISGGETCIKAPDARGEPLRGGAKQFSQPRHELACHYSPGSRTRSRAVELCGLDESEFETVSDVERKRLKEADEASREVIRHSLTSYVTKAIRDITEGGKSEKNEIHIIGEVRSALSPVCPD